MGERNNVELRCNNICAFIWTLGYNYFFFYFFFFGSPKSISYFIAIVSGCDGGNRTRNIAVNTWRLKPLSYSRHPVQLLLELTMRQIFLDKENIF
jgi:hypothetical protein